MPSEIERKFLVSELPPGLDGGQAIEQGYLAISATAEVRLRRAGEKLTLTVKRGGGEVREEAELRLYREQFERLWPLTAGARLRKRRHRLALADELVAEVDIYAGELDGLRVAEVEFGSEAAAGEFEPPAWAGRELTGEAAYSNQSLATHGLPGGDHDSKSGAAGGKVGKVSSKQNGGYRLRRQESAAEGVRRVAAERAEKAIERLRGADEDDAAAAIHGARKDLKKIRAVLRLVREDLGEKTYRAENRRYRDAGRLLSASRDATVKLETLAGLRERYGSAFPASLTGAWTAALEADRERTEGATGGDRIGEAIEAISAAAARIPDWPLSEGSWSLVGPGLVRSYSRGRRALKQARAEGSAADVHELRKRVKDLWYHLRLSGDAWPGPLEAEAEEAHRLADLLGDHHDLAVLAADLGAREGLDTNRARAEKLIAERQEELLNAALDLGARLYAEKPKCFRRRLRAYWRAWRAEESR